MTDLTKPLMGLALAAFAVTGLTNCATEGRRVETVQVNGEEQRPVGASFYEPAPRASRDTAAVEEEVATPHGWGRVPTPDQGRVDTDAMIVIIEPLEDDELPEEALREPASIDDRSIDERHRGTTRSPAAQGPRVDTGRVQVIDPATRQRFKSDLSGRMAQLKRQIQQLESQTTLATPPTRTTEQPDWRDMLSRLDQSQEKISRQLEQIDRVPPSEWSTFTTSLREDIADLERSANELQAAIR